MKLKKVLLIMLLLGLTTTGAYAAGINLFALAKDSFFELASSYVFLVVIGVILFVTGLKVMETHSMSPLIWGGVAVAVIAIVPIAAPNSIDFFKTFAPASTVNIAP